MAFIEPMHRNKPNITYLLCVFGILNNEILYIALLDAIEYNQIQCADFINAI